MATMMAVAAVIIYSQEPITGLINIFSIIIAVSKMPYKAMA